MAAPLEEMALKRVVEQVVEQDPEYALSLLTQALATRQLGPVADQEKIVAAIRERRLGPEGEESSRSVRGEEEHSAETTRQILNSESPALGAPNVTTDGFTTKGT